jgi:hypothetical protein
MHSRDDSKAVIGNCLRLLKRKFFQEVKEKNLPKSVLKGRFLYENSSRHSFVPRSHVGNKIPTRIPSNFLLFQLRP